MAVKVPAASHLLFGSRLLRQLLKRNERNVFVSPVSLELALGMAAAGARGKTLASIEHALGADAASAGDRARQLLTSLDTLPPGMELEFANGLWARSGLPLSRPYADAVRARYWAQVSNLDFTAPGATKVVNDWAARATRGQITAAVNSLDASSILVLVNAAYFRAGWMYPFRPEETTDHQFTTASDDRTEVRLMRQTEDFDYMEDSEIQAIRLHYQRGRFSLLVVLPRKPQPVAAFGDLADPSSLARIVAELDPQYCLLGLPRVRLGYEADLETELLEMGMAAALAHDADFSAVFDAPVPGFISRVSHRTRLDIDEKGTTAAATTEIEGTLGERWGPPPKPIEMVVDRPFLVALTDCETDRLLFIGVIGDPTPE
jgi:serine protease inhibitor